MHKAERRRMTVLLILLGLGVAFVAGLAVPEGNVQVALQEEEMSVTHLLPGGAKLNGHVFLFVLTMLWGLTAIGCEMFAEKIKLHRLTLVLVLLAGVMGVLCRPVLENSGWDELVHRELVYIFSGYSGYSLPDYMTEFSTWFFGYIPYTLGVAAGAWLGLSELAVSRLAALSGVAVYAAVTSLAVKHTPRWKLTFAAIAVLPVCIAIAGFISYDMMAICFPMLFLALLLEELGCPDQKLTGGRSLAMTTLMVLGTIAKPAYSLLLMMMWMLPESKFANKGRQWQLRLFVLVLLVLCFVSMTLGTYDNVAGGDARMGATDSAGQLAWILQNPGAFVQMLGSYLRHHGMNLFTGVGATWGMLDQTLWASRLTAAVVFLLCPLCSLGERQEKPLLTGRRRVALAAAAWLPLLGLMLAQYLVSTAVGSNSIAGMQPRYTLPVMAFMALALMFPEKIRRKAAPLGRLTAALSLALVWGCVYFSAYERILQAVYGL